MNGLKAIYCNQYEDLKNQGKEYATRKNGTILVTVTILLTIFIVFILLYILVPDFENDAARFLKNTFGYSTGKSRSMLIVLLIGVPIYLMVKYTIGSSKSYHKTIAEYLSLNKEQRKKISEKGIVYLLGSVFLFIVCFVILMLKSFI